MFGPEEGSLDVPMDAEVCGCLDGSRLFTVCFGVLMETKAQVLPTSNGTTAQLTCIALLKGKDKQFLLHAAHQEKRIRANGHYDLFSENNGHNSLEFKCQSWLDAADEDGFDRAEFVKALIRGNRKAFLSSK